MCSYEDRIIYSIVYTSAVSTPNDDTHGYHAYLSWPDKIRAVTVMHH